MVLQMSMWRKQKHIEMFIGAGTFDPMTRYAEKIYDRLTQELEFPIIKFETNYGGFSRSLPPYV